MSRDLSYDCGLEKREGGGGEDGGYGEMYELVKKMRGGKEGVLEAAGFFAASSASVSDCINGIY